ncbi:GDSL-type esterase/lipase family protein [Streptomyces sp. V4-01]|uniref:GDSL-type esterase/lipase family protein n=1 Tax=Actinacidiphila polyblastidii TaxID=3110430 RepID=A0ABU7P9B1_9ACTN|nr:GDSL-type esterase/lipase family protein [Streptomyces sp. V4-01]
MSFSRLLARPLSGPLSRPLAASFLRRSAAVRAALAAALLALAVLLVPSGPAHAAATVRVMPLGDSITGSPGCWRALLWQQLQAAGHTDVDMVGTLPAQGCGVPYDGDNEGHGGILATGIAGQNLLPGWLSATHPDIVMMHLGTNDVWNGIAPDTILAAFSTMLDQMRASNPSIALLVARITPMAPANCPACGQRVVDFDARIPAWAAAHGTAQSPVTVVDQWTGYDTAADTYDGVHPNDSGNAKIAARWLPALSAALTGGGPTAPPTTPPPTTTPPTTPPPTSPPSGAACTAVAQVTNAWPGGFQAQVTVTGTGALPVTGWSVRLALPSGAAVPSLWNAVADPASPPSTFRNAPYNGAIAPSASTSFGLVVNAPGTALGAPVCTAS